MFHESNKLIRHTKIMNFVMFFYLENNNCDARVEVTITIRLYKLQVTASIEIVLVVFVFITGPS